jgi:hypothetical protein
MADNVAVTAGSGTTIAADEVVDATLGTVKVQYVKLMDGTLDGTTKAAVGAGGLSVAQATGSNLHVTVDSATGLAQGSTTSGQTGSMVMGAVTTAAPSYTTAQTSPLSVNVAGSLRTSVEAQGINTGYYVAVAASQTDSVIQSSSGATGDYLDYVIVVPATTAPGVVTIKDNATALISYPGGGTTALLTLTPFTIPVGAISRSGAWKVTTGANVSILAVGKFS